VAPEHSDDGVDLTLIRWMLSLTARERLAVLQDQVDSLLTLRAKFESQVLGNTESTDPASRDFKRGASRAPVTALMQRQRTI
jgi:hypothetical protein